MMRPETPGIAIYARPDAQDIVLLLVQRFHESAKSIAGAFGKIATVRCKDDLKCAIVHDVDRNFLVNSVRLD